MDRIKQISKAADHGWSAFFAWSGRVNGFFRMTRADLIEAVNGLFDKPNAWKNMQRRGEVRPERVVLIPQADFQYLMNVAEAAQNESTNYCRKGCNCKICRALYPDILEEQDD